MPKSSTAKSRKRYSYDGPVCEFDRVITPAWHAETMATSAASAKCNMMFQFKKEYNKAATTKITLPGKVVVVE